MLAAKTVYIHMYYVTRSRKREQVTQKFEIALLLPAHSTFYCEYNGTQIAGIRATVVELLLHPSQKPWNGGFELTHFEI